MRKKMKVKIKNNVKENLIYPSASVMLNISMDEYAKERERTNTLDSKANAFISVIIAILTIYIPVIPFSKLISAYSQFGKLGIVGITIILCVMIASIILIVIAFANLYGGYRIQPFYRVDFSNLNEPTLLQHAEDSVKKGMVDHYNTILKGNADINTRKAEKISIGLKCAIISFLLLSLSTISLIIVIGGVGSVG